MNIEFEENDLTDLNKRKREETYVSIGTPLPIIEDFDAAAKKNTKPVIQAREHGEKILRGSDMPRLHGAFTGGFSAGFFNTVGSKEGFVPTTFVSSRQNRAQSQEQKASDFMDQEDMSEHGITPREIRASEDFMSDMKAEQDSAEIVKRLPSSSIPELGTAISDLVAPAKRNIGTRLLMSMGWRHGKKVGHVDLTENRTIPSSLADTSVGKVYGCSLPEGFLLPEGDEDAEYVSTSGDMQSPYSFVAKSNMHGLGYSGICTSTLDVKSSGLFIKPGKRGIKGQAFGVGYEGDDPEDADIYANDSFQNYDFSLEDEKLAHPNNYHGWTAPRLTGSAKVINPKVPYGFVPAINALFRKKALELPSIPADYKPLKQKFQQTFAPSVGRFDVEHKLTASIRSAILEEDGSKSASVFDFIPKSEKEKMDQAVAASKSREIQSNIKKSPQPSNAPQFDPNRPFASDPEKQSRYEAFLQFKQINKSYDDLDLPFSMTEWERQQEREQFERSARLLQPLSWSISQRFTKGSDESKSVSEIHTSTGHLDDKKNAVKLKMFGNLTRSTVQWYPAPLLCKRFNVKNPFPDSQIIGVPKVRKDKFSLFDFLNVNTSEPDVHQPSTPVSSANDKSFDITEHSNLSSEIDQTVQQDFEPNEEERPSMDIFSTIFGDESDVEQSEDLNKGSAELQSDKKETYKAPVDNSEKEKREEGINAFLVGIFGAHTPHPKEKAEPIETASSKTAHSQPEKTSSEYGPKLPLHLAVGVSSIIHDSDDAVKSVDLAEIISSESDEVEFIESSVKSKVSKHKKAKKKKSKYHHKSKTKKRM